MSNKYDAWIFDQEEPDLALIPRGSYNEPIYSDSKPKWHPRLHAGINPESERPKKEWQYRLKYRDDE